MLYHSNRAYVLAEGRHSTIKRINEQYLIASLVNDVYKISVFNPKAIAQYAHNKSWCMGTHVTHETRWEHFICCKVKLHCQRLWICGVTALLWFQEGRWISALSGIKISTLGFQPRRKENSVDIHSLLTAVLMFFDLIFVVSACYSSLETHSTADALLFQKDIEYITVFFFWELKTYLKISVHRVGFCVVPHLISVVTAL